MTYKIEKFVNERRIKNATELLRAVTIDGKIDKLVVETIIPYIDFNSLYKSRRKDVTFLEAVKYYIPDWMDFFNIYHHPQSDECQRIFEDIPEYWNHISMNSCLEIIRNNIHHINFELLSTYNIHLDVDFLKEYNSKIDWRTIVFNPCIDTEIIREFGNLLNWNELHEHYIFSMDEVEEFINNIRWDYISDSTEMNIEFFLKYQDKLDWDIIIDRIDEFAMEPDYHMICDYIKTQRER